MAPNPAREEMRLRYQIPQSCRVEIAIYNPAGQAVRKIDLGQVKAGSHQTRLALGLPQGIYYYRLTAGRDSAVGRLTVLK